MNSSGTKFVEWVTIHGALVELINMYPGTVDSAGLPWYSVSVNMAYDQFSPRPDIDLIKRSAPGAKMGDVGVYKIGNVIRVAWDYNHLWSTPKSYKLWKVHASDFMNSMDMFLSEHGIVYLARCQRCDRMFPAIETADVSDIPGTHYWATVCVKCKNVIKDEMLLH